MTDPIADYLTRVRNAYLAGKKVVEIPSSKMKVAITQILCEKGYILSYKVVEGTPFNTIKIALKYHPQTKMAAIKKIERVSTPGLRRYTGVEDMPRVLNGLGIAILSTPKGVITDKEAKELGVGLLRPGRPAGHFLPGVMAERNLVYFVADVHLGQDAPDAAAREDRFVRFLKELPAERMQALYLLGDIWDFWYEYRDVVPLIRRPDRRSYSSSLFGSAKTSRRVGTSPLDCGPCRDAR